MPGGVEFQEDWDKKNLNLSYFTEREQAHGIVGWLIRHQVVKDVTSANIVLLIFAGIIFALAAGVFFFSGKEGGSGKPTYLEDIPFEERQNIPDDILESLPSKYDR